MQCSYLFAAEEAAQLEARGSGMNKLIRAKMSYYIRPRRRFSLQQAQQHAEGTSIHGVKDIAETGLPLFER